MVRARRLSWRLLPALIGLSALRVTPAAAAGGAHVIDDADVETPGHCHLESWLASDHGSRTGVLGPACTLRDLPMLELDGFFIRAKGTGGTMAGFGTKLNVRATERGFGAALTPSIVFDTRSGKAASAAIIMPMSVPIATPLQINFDVGAVWGRGDQVRAFAGAQAMVAVTAKLQAMIESFVRSGSRAGQQAGLRWIVDRSRIDIDLLVGRYLDGRASRTATIGVTIRR